MDSLSWFALGALALLVVVSQAWGRAAARRRAAGARAWAAARGLAELPAAGEGVPGDGVVRRLRAVPSFAGALDSRQVSVVATRTRGRYGPLWALCTRQPGRAPLFIANVVGFSFARAVGAGLPRGWVPAKLGTSLDGHFFFSVPAGAPPPALSAEAQAALEAEHDVFAFSRSVDGLAVLWFREAASAPTEAALTRATQVFDRLLG